MSWRSDCLSELERVQNNAHYWCRAINRHAFITVQRLGPIPQAVLSVQDWAGQFEEGASNAPFIGPMKANELTLMDKEILLSTPTGYEKGCGWKGGVRYKRNIVSVSKWSETQDALFAMLLLFSMEQEVYLHHVGVRMASSEERDERMFALMEQTGNKPMYKPVSDHIRHYIWVPEECLPNKGYYFETQWWQDGPKDNAAHWDVATSDPHILLQLTADVLGTKPIWFEDREENDPVGVVWANDPSGKYPPLGLMARERWWNIR